MLLPDAPALILAPMEGVTDAPMRALQGAGGAFTFAVSEFLRVTRAPLPRGVILRHVPELAADGRTRTGLPVQTQLLGGWHWPTRDSPNFGDRLPASAALR